MGIPVGSIGDSLNCLGNSSAYLNDMIIPENLIPCEYNPLGFYVRADGKFFEDKEQKKEIELQKDDAGYLYYEKDGKKTYAHRIVVFTFGDCRGMQYNKYGFRSIIDHLDMKHSNNDVTNLQLVSQGINLFRAYYKTGLEEPKKRFQEYYDKLDSLDKMILDKEIQADIQGMY